MRPVELVWRDGDRDRDESVVKDVRYNGTPVLMITKLTGETYILEFFRGQTRVGCGTRLEVTK